MQIVKIREMQNGPGRVTFALTLPPEIRRELTVLGVTHMTAERFDGGILYRPIEPRKETQ